jgi:hypothetical protein
MPFPYPQIIVARAASLGARRGHGSAVSLLLLIVGKRHCRVQSLYYSDEEKI